MTNRTITSADSTFLLVSNEYLLGIELEGYAADAAFAMDSVDTAEVQIGVDGKLSSGWVPSLKPQTITFQPDSLSIPILNGLIQAQNLARTTYFLTGTVTLPGNKMTYTLVRGVMRSYTPMPTAARVLQPQVFGVTWQDVIPIPIG